MLLRKSTALYINERKKNKKHFPKSYNPFLADPDPQIPTTLSIWVVLYFVLHEAWIQSPDIMNVRMEKSKS